jgi:hypothetical protein
MAKNKKINNPNRWGVSFSIKQARAFGQDPKNTLNWLIDQGFRRFRLMSYWDEHEKTRGQLDFSQLDWQIKAIEKVGGVITLCLGARQPRWPENHWPDWAWQTDYQNRTESLLNYIQAVVRRYKGNKTIVSYQLENEALLKSFGERSEVSRARLRQEYDLIRSLDPKTPIAMTTSTSWGIPIRKPRPKLLGFSLYNVVYDPIKNKYGGSEQKPWVYRLRARLYNLLNFGKQRSFIHELQLEPWGPKAIWEMDSFEQDKSMSVKQIDRSMYIAKQMNLYPVDMWGGEWWYQRHKLGDSSIIEAVLDNLG